MSYYSKNCMITKEQCEKIRKYQEKRIENIIKVQKAAEQFFLKCKEKIEKQKTEKEEP